ncbi:hypothetical protein [Marinomonas atlantica]|uniref:hypothetical protein n=1 Tax=Marinomonas atlantica TaxID=1806668 RepID=UPI00082B4E3F|nr:hypothetical protein [Marinomonas atlantica]MCO4784726.1 hypothetical protein [Marinomonas atlantica]
MTALIVVFITLSLMGSALWIMPTRREREKMALRMQARKHNITVQLTSVNLPDKWDKVKVKETGLCAYHKYREKPLKDFPDINIYPYEVWKHESICEGWYANKPISIDSDIGALLEKHHAVFVAIEISANCVSLYWREKGDESTVNDANAIITGLLSLR